MGWFDQLMGASPPAAPPPAAPSPPQSGGWADRILPQTEIRSTTAAPAAGRVDDPARAAQVGVIGNASLLPDAEDQITLYSRQMGIPRNLFGVDRDGQIIYSDPQNGGAYTRVVPSVTGGSGVSDTLSRGARWLASQGGPSISAGGALLGSMIPGAGGVPGAAGGAFVADLGRQALGRSVAGLNPMDVNLPNAAGQGLLGAAGQGIGTAATSFLTRNPLGVNAADRIAAGNRGNMGLWQRNYNEAAGQGITLDVSQATGLPSLIAQGRQLRRFPETMDTRTRFLENQQLREVPQAMEDNITRNVGPRTSVEDAAGNNPQFPGRDPVTGQPLPRPGIRGAAQDIIDAAEEARTAASAPHYGAAYASGVVPDVSALVQSIDTRLATGGVARGSATERALQQARTALTEEVITNAQTGARGTQPLQNYEGLGNAKLVIDNILRNMSRGANPPAAAEVRAAERELVPVQQDLTRTLRNAHPEWDQGYQAYIAASPAVEAVSRDLGALANLNGSERIQILDGVFSRGSGITPERVDRMRQAFLINGRMNEWNGALASWMDNRLTTALAPIQNTNEVPNVAHRLFSQFSDPRQQAIMRAALPQAEARNLEAFFNVLDNARRFSPIGSTTATDTAAVVTPSGVGRAVTLAGQATSPQTLLNMGNLVADAVNVARTPQARIQLSRAFADPDALRELGRLRMLSPTSEQAVRLVSQFIATHTGTAAGGALMPPTPRMPGAAGGPTP